METCLSRVPLGGGLVAEEKFLATAQHLHALVLQRIDRERRQSNYLNSLKRQISAVTHVLEEQAKADPHLRDLWKRIQAELHKIETQQERAA